MATCDVIVIGLGAMGASACGHLARRGLSVVGLEQFALGHDHGSSHGHTRIIRQAYFEHPDYVPLLKRVYDAWADIEEQSGRQLTEYCGVMIAGPPQGEVVAGVRRAVELHELAVDEIPRDRLATKFPGFAVPDGHEVLFEPHAGLLHVERSVETLWHLARAHGAKLHAATPVTDLKIHDKGVEVECQEVRFSAGRLVIAAGAWTSHLLGEWGVRLEVLRKVQLWYAADDGPYRLRSGCPVFGFETADGEFFYGMPAIDERGFKVGEHSGRDIVTHPETVDRELRVRDRERVEQRLGTYLTTTGWALTTHSTCLYTMTADQHFILDRHRDHEHVWIAAGFSGHGFKFAPVVGEVLADWAVDGRTTQPVGFLSARRPGIAG